MNKREHLIAATLGDGDGEAAARTAARHARRRRTVKQAGLAGGLACALAALFVLNRPPETQITPAPVATVPAVPAPVVEIISDQELLAQLRDQPVLVLKDQTGITGVVFLAQQRAPEL